MNNTTTYKKNTESFMWEDEKGIGHKLSTRYSEESDTTFIMEERFVNDECFDEPFISEEVVGFLYGNITDIGAIITEYNRHSLKAEFHDEYYAEIMVMLRDIRAGIDKTGEGYEEILNSKFTLEWSYNGRKINLGWGAAEVQGLEQALQNVLDNE